MKFTASVPDRYPEDIVSINVDSHNFPDSLVEDFLARLDAQQFLILNGTSINTINSR